MEGRYNVRSPAVKRLMKEAQELSEPTDQYFAQPLEDNLFEWHFTVRGPADSDFQNGIYHGRIILPVDYPMKPPSIIWLTPNGRFETNKKICLSISGHHPESWQPSWSIRTALLAIIGFMPTRPGGAIGSLDYKPEERKVLAKKSRSWKCPSCGDVSDILLPVSSSSPTASKEAKELAAQISFQGEKPKTKSEDNKSADDASSGNGNEAATTAKPSSGQHDTTDNASKSDVSQIPSSACKTTTSSSTPPAPTTNPAAPFRTTPTSSFNPSPGIATPPWNVSPMFQPYGCCYTGQNATSQSMSAMPARFPYPPSYYTAASSSSFYPPGCALPPGVGMFPCPPPPPFASSQLPQASLACNMVSANNSTVPSAGAMSHSNRAQTSVSYTPTPVASQGIGNQSHEGAVTNERSASGSNKLQDESTTQKCDRKEIMSELLTKVRRVGSDDSNVDPKEEIESPVDGDLRVDVNTEIPVATIDKESSLASGRNMGAIETPTDSEVSKSLRKNNSRGDVTHSEILPSDTENSEIGVPPIEVSESEQRSVLEKSTCNSTPELEQLKNKQLPSKGLRQRQSAMASVSANTEDDGGDENATGINPSAATQGQRIEAESGDSRPTHTIPPEDQIPRVRHLNQEPVRVNPGGPTRLASTYDVSFFIMVAFFIGAVGILLNRLFAMYWAADLM